MSYVGGPISDGSNAVGNVTARSLTDAATPVIKSAVYRDAGLDGSVETAVVVFTEPVAYLPANEAAVKAAWTLAAGNLTGSAATSRASAATTPTPSR